MSGRISLWGAREILLTLFGQQGLAPVNFHIALVKTTIPTPFMDGSELEEPATTGDGYARAAISNLSSSWEITDYDTITNAVDIVFPAATLDWGDLRYWAMCSAATEGEIYFYGALDEEFEVLAGEQVEIGAGMLMCTIGPVFLEVD